MAETPSTMIPLGTRAPAFDLLDVRTGKQVSLTDCQSTVATVVMFICNHCPYVKLIMPKVLDVATSYQAKGIRFVAISSNDADNYPQDGPASMKALAEKDHYPFPYLYDETQTVAKAYHAACTPDFFVFDSAMACVYRGRFDDATPGNKNTVTGKDLCQALDQVLAKQPVSEKQLPSVGCNIKWKK